ncbi:hypothetical protein ASD15_00180 [Massilia sp. Root351]|nr:hypothetical protein ASD15_00180 [Massilia sp. Root351]
MCLLCDTARKSRQRLAGAVNSAHPAPNLAPGPLPNLLLGLLPNMGPALAGLAVPQAIKAG